jgi:hypothetical protein
MEACRFEQAHFWLRLYKLPARVRERWVMRRTAVVNQVRSLLLIHWRRPTAIVCFSLATLRRTIHADNPVYQDLQIISICAVP